MGKGGVLKGEGESMKGRGPECGREMKEFVKGRVW